MNVIFLPVTHHLCMELSRRAISAVFEVVLSNIWASSMTILHQLTHVKGVGIAINRFALRNLRPRNQIMILHLYSCNMITKT